MKVLAFFLFVLVAAINLFSSNELTTTRQNFAPADTLKSMSAGNFNTASTWNHNRIPTATDYIICRHNVVFSGNCHLYDKRIETGVAVVYSTNCHLYFRL